MTIFKLSGPSAPLSGVVTLSGAKNSALKVLSATVLAKNEIVLDNIPLDIHDVNVKLQMLRSIGAAVCEDRPGRVRVSWPPGTPKSYVPGEFGAVRTSLLLLGALLGRIGQASVPIPGGCPIGERKHDLHFMALNKLGAHCYQKHDRIEADSDHLVGGKIVFPFRTTGGTENALLASVVAKGKTLLYNAHTRPEVRDLANFLNKMGGNVSLLGSGLVEINGVEELTGGYYSIIHDNMEAMTFAIYAAITRGKVKIRHFPSEDLEVPLVFLREAGLRLITEGDSLVVECPGLLAPFDLSTGTYPGINSDMQPLFAVLATQAEGISRITDIRFQDRFQYVEELCKMGADMTIEDNTVIIKGPTKLFGTSVKATDLRGGAALLAAALVAEGETEINHAEQIDRGYEKIDTKLKELGKTVERFTS